MKKFIAMIMVVAMMFAIAIPMSAEISPKPNVNVETGVVPGNGGEIDKVVNADGTITITIKPNSGYDFVNWEITGQYEIKGDKTDKTITIKPITDVKVQAVMKAQSTTKPVVKPGTSSPSTGVAPVMMAVAFVGSMAAAGYSFKKSSK